MSSTSQSGGGRRSKKLLVGVIVFVGALITAALLAAMVWPPINDVTTGETPEYPDIQPQVLRYSPELVLERAGEAIEALSRWQEISRAVSAGLIEAEATTTLFGFTDDVTIRIEPYGAGSLVNVHSRSRVGGYDFGQNARNIRRFQAALEEHLQLARQVR